MSKKHAQNTEKANPKVKDILLLLAAGVFIPAAVIFPGLPLVIKPFLDYKREKDYKEWKKFNQARLKQTLRRLQNQKAIAIIPSAQESLIKITEKGQKKVLKFKLEDMKLQKRWDGKWRLIIYDIPKYKKRESDNLRQILKHLECFRLQKSVYLTPHPCEDEIEYLRQIFDIGDEVKILKVANIENEKPYRDYFGI